MFGVDWDNRPSESVHATDNSEQLVSLEGEYSPYDDFESVRYLEQHTVDCLGDSHSEDSINFDLREHNRDDGPQEQSHLRSQEAQEMAFNHLWLNLSQEDYKKRSSRLCAPGCSLSLLPMKVSALKEEIDYWRREAELMTDRQLVNIPRYY